MPIDLLDNQNKPLDLLSNEESIPEQNIQSQYPNMPDWVRKAILSITPKNDSPLLGSAARSLSNITDYIPSAVGGALQGASIPIRGVSGLIPTEFTQKLSNAPDFRNFFPPAHGTGQKTVQMGAELLGGGGLFGKLFQGAKALSQAAKIPKMLQNATALGASGAIGTPGDATDRALGSGGALALGGAGKATGKASEKIPAFFRGIFNESTPDTLVSSIQKPHDILENSVNDLYGKVKNSISSRNIKIPIKEEYLEQAKEHFPKNTRSYQELINKAKSGDYEAIHKIQSSLYKKGTKALSSDDLAIENQGEDILDLRNKINEDLNNHLIGEGHLDIAHILSQGKKINTELMNTYYPKNLRKSIGKMVNSETRLVPTNLENIFKENSKPMRDFLNKHPEISKHVKGIIEKEEAQKLLKNLMIGGAGTGGSIIGGKTIYDLLK